MFAASLSWARVHWKADEWTLADLLREGHVTAAVATLAYLPETESVSQVCGLCVVSVGSDRRDGQCQPGVCVCLCVTVGNDRRDG